MLFRSLLGFVLDSNAKKLLNETKKVFEKLAQSDLEKPLYPIYIFPVLELNIVTFTNKKFKLFSIGSELKYQVLELVTPVQKLKLLEVVHQLLLMLLP